MSGNDTRISFAPQHAVLFVTGTDTGVGKTVSSCVLARAFESFGLHVGVSKPVESGCERGADGELLPSDASQLIESVSSSQSLDEVCIYRFQSPVAPLVASRVEGGLVEPERLVRHIYQEAARYDLLLVEGAGGLLVPLTETYTYAELIRDCRMMTLVVVGSRLGAINHAALTFEVLTQRNLATVGYLLNQLFEGERGREETGSERFVTAHETNRELLREVAFGYGIKELGCMPYLGEVASDDTIRRFSETADATQLARSVLDSFVEFDSND